MNILKKTGRLEKSRPKFKLHGGPGLSCGYGGLRHYPACHCDLAFSWPQASALNYSRERSEK